MAQITIATEEDCARGWKFAVVVMQDSREHHYTVSLSWPDYDLWSRGQHAPERVVRAAFEFLLARESPSEIFSQFDCAVIRRYFPEVDRELPRLI